jgi:hypothetical protein
MAYLELTSGIQLAAANSIAVSGSDVYVAGYEWNGSIFVGKYWKNGAPFVISGTTSATTAGICLNQQ